jgi:Tol biopolymer transport system component
MRKLSLWRIGVSSTVICFLFGCTTAIERESISTVAADPTWTPTPTLALSERIAFTSDRDGDQNIYVMNTDGTGQRRLTDDPARDWAPAWSPDGRFIAFYSERGDNIDVYVMNVDGSEQHNLSQLPDMGTLLHIASPPSWSPDGRSVLFGCGHRGDMGYRIYEIYVVDADGSNLRNLGYGLSPVWSSDGDSILLVYGGHPTWAIWEMNADGSNRRYLTSVTLDGLWWSSLAVSPDGRSIVFGYNGHDTGSYEVYIVDADGSNLRYLTENPAYDGEPTWSPDGRFITFASSRDGNDEIYVMNADESNQRNLSQHPANDTAPAWSP